jgi:hypothetical protein
MKKRFPLEHDMIGFTLDVMRERKKGKPVFAPKKRSNTMKSTSEKIIVIVLVLFVLIVFRLVFSDVLNEVLNTIRQMEQVRVR